MAVFLHHSFKYRSEEFCDIYGDPESNTHTLNSVFTMELRRLIASSTLYKHINEYTNLEPIMLAGESKPRPPWMVSVKVKSEEKFTIIFPDAVKEYYKWASLSNYKRKMYGSDCLLGSVLIESSNNTEDENRFRENGIHLPEEQWSVGEQQIPSNATDSLFKEYAQTIREGTDDLASLNSFDSITVVGFEQAEGLRSANNPEYGKVYELGDAYITPINQLRDPSDVEDLVQKSGKEREN
ncbi:hypothetical protein SAMN05443661_1281 [Natronobacterium gregoryi]|uniref:Uncharacterized protein n=3 Tax=Natronobacterium gregoryi TaxID=44930 RepID=L0AKV5_NATGS|nr:hypothetical protein Natgr_2663 [Natronobacterium gregoryi SP2]SFJ41643.1 hypothetical protein SAMN05443661_1281 [Natronobacterium gregoryi]